MRAHSWSDSILPTSFLIPLCDYNSNKDVSTPAQSLPLRMATVVHYAPVQPLIEPRPTGNIIFGPPAIKLLSSQSQG